MRLRPSFGLPVVDGQVAGLCTLDANHLFRTAAHLHYYYQFEPLVCQRAFRPGPATGNHQEICCLRHSFHHDVFRYQGNVHRCGYLWFYRPLFQYLLYEADSWLRTVAPYLFVSLVILAEALLLSAFIANQWISLAVSLAVCAVTYWLITKMTNLYAYREAKELLSKQIPLLGRWL